MSDVWITELLEGIRDTLLMVGSGFPYSEFLPKEGQARAVQIDIEPEMLSLRYPMEVNLVGDAAETLRALLPLLRERSDHGWRKRIQGWTAKWWKTLEDRANAAGQADQPATRRLGIVTTASGAGDYYQRLRFMRQLVCTRPEDQARHDVLVIGWPCLDGCRGAVRNRRQVCLS